MSRADGKTGTRSAHQGPEFLLITMSVVRVRDVEPIKTKGYGLGCDPFFVCVVSGVVSDDSCGLPRVVIPEE